MKKLLSTMFFTGLMFVCFGQESEEWNTVEEYKVTRVREFYTSEIVNGSKTGYAFIPGNEYAADGSLFIDLKKNTLTFILPFKFGYDKITEKITDKSITDNSCEYYTINYKVIIDHLYHIGRNGVYDIRFLYDFSKELDAYSKFLNITAVSFNNKFGIVQKTEQAKNSSEQSQSKKDEIDTRSRNAFGITGENSEEKDMSESERKSTGVSYSLSGRSAKSLPVPEYPGDDEGMVVVKITVDRFGNVTEVEPGVRGTTITNELFLIEAKHAALKAKFDTNENAPASQRGTISYRFVKE